MELIVGHCYGLPILKETVPVRLTKLDGDEASFTIGGLMHLSGSARSLKPAPAHNGPRKSTDFNPGDQVIIHYGDDTGRTSEVLRVDDYYGTVCLKTQTSTSSYEACDLEHLHIYLRRIGERLAALEAQVRELKSSAARESEPEIGPEQELPWE